MVLTAAQVAAFFTDQAQMGIDNEVLEVLEDQGINTPDDLLDYDDVMLDRIHKRITRDDELPVFSERSLVRIKTAAAAVRFYDQVGRETSAPSLRWSHTLRYFKMEMDSLKIAKEQPSPEVPRISKALPVMKWASAFKSVLHDSYGVRGFPLTYVIRENDEVPAAAPPLAPNRPYSLLHGSLVAEFAARASHDNPRFVRDNSTVYGKLEEATRGTTYASTIKPYENARNGRGAYKAIVAQFLGKGKWNKEIEKYDEFLHTHKWKGQGTFTLERYINMHRDAYQQLVNAAEHVDYQLPNDFTRVGYLLKGISTNDPGLHAVMAQVETDETEGGPRQDFEDCARILQKADPVAKRAKRPHSNISGVEGENQGPVLDAKVAALRSGIGKTGVHLRFHKPEEFKALTAEQKTELFTWRETPEGKTIVAQQRAQYRAEKKKQRKANKKQKGANVSALIEKEFSKRIKAAKKEAGEQKNLDDAIVGALTRLGVPIPPKENEDSSKDDNKLLAKILGRAT